MPNEKVNIEELELEVADNEVEEPTELDVEVEVEEEIELDAETETEIPPTEPIEDAEEDSEASEEAEEAEAEEEAEVEEAEVEELAADVTVEDEDESDEDDGFAETLASLQKQIETLNDTIKELTEANIALKKSNRKLSNKLQAEKNKKDEFIENIKGLSVQLLPEEEKKKPKEEKVDHSAYCNGDGIGEI